MCLFKTNERGSSKIPIIDLLLANPQDGTALKSEKYPTINWILMEQCLKPQLDVILFGQVGNAMKTSDRICIWLKWFL